MDESVNRAAEPAGRVASSGGLTSKIRAWIEEKRFERSLAGPGAHRQAYRRLLGSTDHEVPPVQPVPPEIDGRQPKARHSEAPTGAQAPRSGRPPRSGEPRARRASSRSSHGRTLFAVSAVAAGVAAAPLGYFAFDLMDNEFSAATEQVLLQAKAIEPPAAPPPRQPAAAKPDSKPLDPVRAVSRPESIAVTKVAKVEAGAPFESLAEAAAFRARTPEPQKVSLPKRPQTQVAARADMSAASQGKTAPSPIRVDPRAAALLEQGEKLANRGEIAAARGFFDRAAELGDVRGLLQLARTYDPVALRDMKVVGITPEPDKAVSLYNKVTIVRGGEATNRPTSLSLWLTK